jgi:nitrate/nitrite transporter NarK
LGRADQVVNRDSNSNAPRIDPGSNNEIKETPRNNGRVFNISLLIICQSFQALTIGGLALFLPIIRADLGLTFTQGGTLAAVSTLIYALNQIPSGYLADRWGGRRLFAIGIAGVTVLSVTFGLVTEYWQALLNQSLSGFFRALLFAPGLTLITGWFSPEKRATAMGLFLIGGFSGNVVLDVAGPILVANFDWRFPFLVFPPLGMIAALLLWRLGKDPPSTGQNKEIKMGEVLHLFRVRFMWACGAMQFIRLGVMQGISFWLPTLLMEEKGVSLQITGLLIALSALLIAPSNIVGGYLSDRLKNPILVISVALFVLAITTTLLVVVNNFALLVIVIAINSIFLQMYFGPLFALPVEVMGRRYIGITSGFSNLFANIGSFVTVYLLGVLKEATSSFLSGFLAIAAACIVGLGVAVILGRMRSKALAQDV